MGKSTINDHFQRWHPDGQKIHQFQAMSVGGRKGGRKVQRDQTSGLNIVDLRVTFSAH